MKSKIEISINGKIIQSVNDLKEVSPADKKLFVKLIKEIFVADFRANDKNIIALKTYIKELETALRNFSLHLYNALEEILQDKTAFYYPDLKTFNVIDTAFEENVKLEVRASEIICILTIKDRKKLLVVNHQSSGSSNNIKLYSINNDLLSFKKLCNLLDPLSRRLVIVSKNAIANVEYYEKVKGDFIQLISVPPSLKPYKKLDLSPKIGYEPFIKIKALFDENISFHKRVLAYRISMDE